ncbi:MAG: CDGSH iron-sulfur domain-containing protein [Aestuariivirga sp.]|jgi:CDGSH-type Zn-finger protein|uniref:CDGSH iron-sulfur domain-containing protein n=1 Tax=Aestuariivirga sp. TaxID=2650926 RepID=UPI0038D0BA4E
MSEPVIAQKAPIPVEVEAGKDYWWCSCGQSKRQPFCDGSHKGSSFNPVKWTAEASGRKFFCACKHSKAEPFCDGSHKAL